jgi:hypothetical protein
VCARNSQTGFNRLSLGWQAIVGVTQIRLRRSYMRDWGMSLILFTDFQLEENEIKCVFVFVSLAYVMMVIGGASIWNGMELYKHAIYSIPQMMTEYLTSGDKRTARFKLLNLRCHNIYDIQQNLSICSLHQWKNI